MKTLLDFRQFFFKPSGQYACNRKESVWWRKHKLWQNSLS